jgi:hypothetical protein
MAFSMTYESFTSAALSGLGECLKSSGGKHESGLKSSPSGQTSGRRLNPEFADWLMSWPPGFTDYARPATAFAAWLGRSRIEFSRIVSKEAENG